MKRTTLTLAALVFAGAGWAETAPENVAFVDGAVAESLTGVAGSPQDGATVISTRSMGNCVACHKVAALPTVDFQGNIGPALDGAGDRWSEAQLRGIVSNAKMMFDGSMMPSFYKTTGYIRPGNAYTGKAAKEPLPPLLTAQQIEDVVSYLLTLK